MALAMVAVDVVHGQWAFRFVNTHFVHVAVLALP